MLGRESLPSVKRFGRNLKSKSGSCMGCGWGTGPRSSEDTLESSRIFCLTQRTEKGRKGRRRGETAG